MIQEAVGEEHRRLSTVPVQVNKSLKYKSKDSNFFQVTELHFNTRPKDINRTTNYPAHNKVHSHCLASNQRWPDIQAKAGGEKKTPKTLNGGKKYAGIERDPKLTQMLELADKDTKCYNNYILCVQKLNQGDLQADNQWSPSNASNIRNIKKRHDGTSQGSDSKSRIRRTS